MQLQLSPQLLLLITLSLPLPFTVQTQNALDFTIVTGFDNYRECVQYCFLRYCAKLCIPGQFDDPIIDCGSPAFIPLDSGPEWASSCLCEQESKFNLGVARTDQCTIQRCGDVSGMEDGRWILKEYCKIHGFEHELPDPDPEILSTTTLKSIVASTSTSTPTPTPKPTSSTSTTTYDDLPVPTSTEQQPNNEPPSQPEPEPDPETSTPTPTLTPTPTSTNANTNTSDNQEQTTTEASDFISSPGSSSSVPFALHGTSSIPSSASETSSPNPNPTGRSSEDGKSDGGKDFGTPEIIGTVVGILSLIVATIGVYLTWRAIERKHKMRAAQRQAVI